MSETDKKRDYVLALRFTQWLRSWDDFEYSDDHPSRKPQPNIYLFSMKASELRTYSDVYTRKRQTERVEGIQRNREERRTNRIREFIRFGYPYGDLRENQRTQERLSLRKPGWLPTAIVINILKPGDTRKGNKLIEQDAAKIEKENHFYKITLPCSLEMTEDAVRPFEIIDGQHRLWAFNEDDYGDQYELPVVAFDGLDVAWQAYLFWSINVTPKRINPSHAFDLYPLLRNQAWLEQTGDLTVYREARAQEITEWLYNHPNSSWNGRISMLGQGDTARVSQAAFVRSLTTAFFGTGRGRTGRYGLFQASISDDYEPLSWTRAQQIALLLELWANIERAIEDNPNDIWVSSFLDAGRDPFSDKSSLLNQDMGVRAVHAVANDLLFDGAIEWRLDGWIVDSFDETNTNQDDIDQALLSLKEQVFYEHLISMARAISYFDWRSLDGPGVRNDNNLMLTRRAYRGSGGYTLLTSDLFRCISEAGNGPISDKATRFLSDT